MNDRSRIHVVSDDADIDYSNGFVNAGRRVTEEDRGDIEWCLEHHALLNAWEVDFLYGMLSFSSMSSRQHAKLNSTIHKVSVGLRLQQSGRRPAP
jgi:hypothetical protein